MFSKWGVYFGAFFIPARDRGSRALLKLSFFAKRKMNSFNDSPKYRDTTSKNVTITDSK